MADEVEKKTPDNASEAEETLEQGSQVDLSQFVPLEDFRKFQSTKDREVAEANRQSEALQARFASLEEQYATLIDDPVKRVEYQNKRQQAELEHYRQREEMTRQRRWFHDQYGVPLEVLADAKDPGETTKLALDWQKEQRTVVPAVEAKKKAVEELEESGGHDVSLSPGTPPERQSVSDTEFDKEIGVLRKVAQSGGSAGVQARRQILVLEARRLRGRSARAKI